MPMLDTFDRTGNLAGISINWRAPGEPAALQKIDVTKIEMIAKSLIILISVTSELLDDMLDGPRRIEAAMALALNYGLDEAFLHGNGVGRPLGVYNSASAVVHPKEGGQSAATIVPGNITGMIARLHPRLFADAVWLVHPNTLGQLLQIAIPSADGGAVSIVRGTSAGMTMYGRPIVLTEHAPALGDEGDLTLVAMSQYLIGMRREIMFSTSSHLGFDTDTIYFRLTARLDGMGKWPQAIALKRGASLSWCVKLAERA